MTVYSYECESTISAAYDCKAPGPHSHISSQLLSGLNGTATAVCTYTANSVGILGYNLTKIFIAETVTHKGRLTDAVAVADVADDGVIDATTALKAI